MIILALAILSASAIANSVWRGDEEGTGGRAIPLIFCIFGFLFSLAPGVLRGLFPEYPIFQVLGIIVCPALMLLGGYLMYFRQLCKQRL